MYKIYYHPKVAKEIEKLEKIDSLLLKKIIEDKIGVKPTFVGKNLQGSLKNYRSFRFGKYRILYKVTKDKIFIITIALRKEIYSKAKKRLGLK